MLRTRPLDGSGPAEQEGGNAQGRGEVEEIALLVIVRKRLLLEKTSGWMREETDCRGYREARWPLSCGNHRFKRISVSSRMQRMTRESISCEAR